MEFTEPYKHGSWYTRYFNIAISFITSFYQFMAGKRFIRASLPKWNAGIVFSTADTDEVLVVSDTVCTPVVGDDPADASAESAGDWLFPPSLFSFWSLRKNHRQHRRWIDHIVLSLIHGETIIAYQHIQSCIISPYRQHK